MYNETEIRAKLAKMYSLLSVGNASHDQMDAACQKLGEAVAILDGTMPVPEEEEKANGN